MGTASDVGVAKNLKPATEAPNFRKASGSRVEAGPGLTAPPAPWKTGEEDEKEESNSHQFLNPKAPDSHVTS